MISIGENNISRSIERHCLYVNPYHPGQPSCGVLAMFFEAQKSRCATSAPRVARELHDLGEGEMPGHSKNAELGVCSPTLQKVSGVVLIF